ncbi:MAG TPA: hypothetical protein ENJ95_13500 [Bacteroidetes bacterium]|nr:hypothetical protein [Bacteroidota bacterium]
MNPYFSFSSKLLAFFFFAFFGIHAQVGSAQTSDIDLSLDLSITDPAPPIYTSTEATLTITNDGPQTATGVVVHFPKPAGTVYTGGNEWTATQGSFNPFGNEQWTVGSLPAGGTASITVSYFLLQNDLPDAYAQVIAANENDVDSTPDNGTPPSVNEDDEASTSPPAPLADLTLDNLQIPSPAVSAGASLHYTFQLQNISTEAVPDSFAVNVFISADSILSADDLMDKSFNRGNLAAGETNYFYDFTSVIPANLSVGNYFLIAKADADGIVPESNEDNNIAVQSFSIVSSQTACIGDIVFRSQADVDSFSGCSLIEGDLVVQPYFGSGIRNTSDIHDLSPLLSVTKVTGAIIIAIQAHLPNLHGLENITAANRLVITLCDSLTNIQALSGLSGEVEDLQVMDNPSLLNLDGLEGITTTNDILFLTNNPALQNLNGLINLTSVHGYSLEIIDNPSLTDIQGLGSLANVSGNFILVNCDALQNLNGLNNLTSVERFILSRNEVLNDVSAVTALTNVDNDFLIARNPMLADCCIFYDLLNSNAIGGPITFENNAGGCNSSSDILVNCGTVICPGNLTLSSQAEVNAFGNCEIIDGQLTIQGGDITDLSPLDALKEVTGALVIIGNSNLSTLEGLNNLTSIGGLVLIDNPLLQNLLPLSNSSSEESGVLILRKNNSMSDLKGLEGITGTRSLDIRENANLQTLEGLDNLAIADGNFSISGNPALLNLNGLNSLHTVKDVFGIHDNAVLADISALAQLSSVYVMAIGRNPSLADLSGLENLNDLWTLSIVNNNALQNLDAFSSLTSITGDLTILENPVLTDCCGIQPLLSGGSIGGAILIEGNPFTCSSGPEVINNCGGTTIGMDLELSMSQAIADPVQWTTYEVVLTLRNAGSAPATGIRVYFPKPSGIVYSGGNEFSTSQGSFSPFGNQQWELAELMAGETATLQVNYFLLQPDAPLAYAQVIAANEEDSDSTPNNGTPPVVNEDDEANSVDPTVTSACSGNIVLNSQAKVNTFGNCEVIDGNLAIIGEDITDLSPLSSLIEVKGSLNIWSNSNLTNLEGLNNLSSVGGLTIRSNPLLENLLPLSNLSSDELDFLFLKKNNALLDLEGLEGVTGVSRLIIEGNTNLLTLKGLNNLSISRGDLVISENPSLLNLNDLNSLLTVNDDFVVHKNDALLDLKGVEGITGANFLRITQNANLQTLEGLNNLSFVENRLDVTDNPSLLNLNGLNNLNSVGSVFGIQRNAALADISALAQLNSSRELIIFYNHSLTNLSGLENLSQLENLTISNNQILNNCCGIHPLLSSGNIGGRISIVANPFPCSNESNILNNCASTICTGDVILESQADVDNFPGCSTIGGNLIIRSPFGTGSASSDITDLSPLLGLTEVTGKLVLENNDHLLNLHGLENITAINGLAIVLSDSLNNIQALSGLGGGLTYITILGNPSLSNLNGLEGITNVSGSITLTDNIALTNLDGLSNLVSVGGVFQVGKCPSFTDMQGLSNLDSVGGTFLINECIALQNLNGLNNLTSAGGFVLADNDVLQDVSAVTSLINVNNSFFVGRNPMLADCCIFYDLLNSNGVGGSIGIQDNAGLCNSATDILDNCAPAGGIDLALALSVTDPAPPIYTSTEATLTITNAGPQTATGIVIDFPRPSGTVYTGGNEWTATQGSFNPFGNEQWTVGSLPAGSTASITVSYFLLQNNLPDAYAQVIAANETDVDSTPNNGTPPSVNEDDEASTGGGSPALPDLVLANLNIQNSPIGTGETLNYNFDISNLGNGAASGNFNVKAWISTDNVLSPDDIQDGTVQTGNYSPGLTQTGISGASAIPANLPDGSYFLIVKVDADDVVTESNEGNNIVFQYFSVTSPQIICIGDVFLESQADVDNFLGCTIIEGTLSIQPPFGVTTSDITDLSPLLSVTQVTGTIVLAYQDHLLDLHGLENIAMANRLVVTICDSLTNIQELSGLSGEMEDIFIMDNQNIKNIDALDKIVTVNRNLYLTSNPSLENLDGLVSLDSVGERFHILSNPKIRDIGGLNNLHGVGLELVFANCDSLKSLEGLNNLTSTQLFVLSGNDVLEDVSALGNLNSVGGDLQVLGNPMLYDCCIFNDLLTNGTIGGSITIENNAPGCNSPTDILDNCAPAGDIDLSLAMSTTNSAPPIYTSTEVTLTIQNSGGQAATGITVGFPRPGGTVYTGGNEWTATQGSFNPFGNEQWTVGSLPAGGTASITVSYFLLSGNALTPYAQVIAANEADADSTPNNGTPPSVNEDDEAALTINAFSGNGGVALRRPGDRFRLVFDKFYPNPAQHWLAVDIYSPEEQEARLDFYDQQGRWIYRKEVQLEKGNNIVEIEVSHWKSGLYNVIGRGNGTPSYGRFLKVWEE